MKTNYKFIGIITLILFIVPTGLSFSFAQNSGYYENDYLNYQAGTRVEINNYYGGYSNRISYASRINRFHRTFVSIDYFTPYYVDYYYDYYTPFMDDWSYYSRVDYYFGVNVFYTPWRYYYRSGFYSVYWLQHPVYYDTYYYNSCRNVPVYYQSAYYGYPSKKYGVNRGYVSYKSNKPNNYNEVNRNYYSDNSTGTRKIQSSRSVANHNRSSNQSNSVGIYSRKRRNQNHLVNNNASKDHQSKYRSSVKKTIVKPKYSSGRRPSGNRYVVTNRNSTSVHNLSGTNTYGNRRTGAGSSVKAKKVTTGRSNTIYKTGNRQLVAQKSAMHANRRSLSPNRNLAKVTANASSKRRASAGIVVQNKSGKTKVVAERRYKR
jgi:hypothetical protein